MTVTTYAYECNGRLFVAEGCGHTEADLKALRMRLIAAWPGALSDMPSSLRPMLQEMYDSPNAGVSQGPSTTVGKRPDIHGAVQPRPTKNQELRTR